MPKRTFSLLAAGLSAVIAIFTFPRPGEIAPLVPLAGTQIYLPLVVRPDVPPQVPEPIPCLPGDASPVCDPVLELKLDENTGTIANDTSENGNTGLLTNGPTWTLGKFATGVNFDGVDDTINAGSGSSLDNLPNNEFSGEAWINLPDAPSGNRDLYFGIMNKPVGEETGWMFNLSWSPTNRYQLWFYAQMSTRNVDYVGPVSLIPGTWHHVAFTYSNAEKRPHLYFDGEEVIYTRETTGAGTYVDDSSNDFLIGQRVQASFPLTIDDIHVFDYSRTPDRIALDFNVVNVKDFGARGDGSTEDQTAFRNAINALASSGGGKLYIPRGIYILVRSDLSLPATVEVHNVSNVEFMGDGVENTILKLKPGVPYGTASDTHVIRFVNSSHITMRDLTLDGSRLSYLEHDEQMHGLYLLNTHHFLVERVKFHQMRGDGVFVIGAQEQQYCPSPPCFTEYVTIRQCWFYDNGRSGIANQGGIRYMNYLDSLFELTSDQDIDLEPTGDRPSPTDMVIQGNILNHSTSPHALTLSGRSSLDPAKRITVTHNTIAGGAVFILEVEDVEFSNNVVTNPLSSQRSPLQVQGYAQNIAITNNYFESTDAAEVLELLQPSLSHIRIENNTIVQNLAGAIGILVNGAGNDITIANNHITGTMSVDTNGYGIKVRIPSNDGITRYDYTVSGNRLRRVARPIKFSTYDAQTKFSDVTITDNIQYDDQVTEPRPMSIIFEAGIGDPDDFIINLFMENNITQGTNP